MAFLSDYIFYSSGNETPEEYLQWGGLSLLGHVLGHKCTIGHGNGYFKFTPNLFVALVGEAGSGKNTALDVNADIMIKHFPDMLMSASVQSREDIAFQMAQDTPTNPATWKDEHGVIHQYRPFYILNEELNNFLSVDKIKMMQFLTQVFDGKRFSTGFKKDRLENPQANQWFLNPHVSLLAGAVPEWFMDNLKMDMFSGGMGRRMFIIVGKRTKIIPFPNKPHGADAAMSRVVEHLKQLSKFVGRLSLDDKAKKWWEPWYIKYRNNPPTDPILLQFHSTKSMQLMKVALNLRMTEGPPYKEVNVEHFEFAEHLINGLEPTIIKLTAGIGRNEYAGIGAQLIDFVRRTGGMQTEVQVKKMFWRYANDEEFQKIVEHHKNNGELFVDRVEITGGGARMFYFTPEGYEEYRRLRAETAAKKLAAAPVFFPSVEPEQAPPLPVRLLPVQHPQTSTTFTNASTPAVT
jgi:hypothetical protein